MNLMNRSTFPPYHGFGCYFSIPLTNHSESFDYHNEAGYFGHTSFRPFEPTSFLRNQQPRYAPYLEQRNSCLERRKLEPDTLDGEDDTFAESIEQFEIIAKYNNRNNFEKAHWLIRKLKRKCTLYCA